jgi:hypothetical protein
MCFSDMEGNPSLSKEQVLLVFPITWLLLLQLRLKQAQKYSEVLQIREVGREETTHHARVMNGKGMNASNSTPALHSRLAEVR